MMAPDRRYDCPCGFQSLAPLEGPLCSMCLPDGSVHTMHMGYGQLVDRKKIRGKWITQRTYWRWDKPEADVA